MSATKSKRTTSKQPTGTTLRKALVALDEIAPLAWAADWDHTGLICSPTRPKRIRHILLTIDLTDSVLEEALSQNADLVIAYHPPLFTAVDRLDPDVPRDRRILKLIESGIALYSPHTALDAAPGGVNDWLAEAVRAGDAIDLETISDPAQPEHPGLGRIVHLHKAIPLAELVQRVKRYLKCKTLRVAKPTNSTRRIQTVALCAGAGASVLAGVEADVYLTGEMKHHDILDAVTRGVTVVLSEHTHTERGYLPHLRKRLLKALDQTVDIQMARTDRDPIDYV